MGSIPVGDAKVYFSLRNRLFFIYLKRDIKVIALQNRAKSLLSDSCDKIPDDTKVWNKEFHNHKDYKIKVGFFVGQFADAKHRDQGSAVGYRVYAYCGNRNNPMKSL